MCFGRSKPEDRKQICPQNIVCYNSTHMMEKVQSLRSTFMPNTVNMFHISAHSASRQAPWIFSILDRCHSISGLCQIASSLKANVNTWNVSAPIFPIWNNNLMHMHCSLKSVIFWSNKTALDTTHSHPAHQCMPQLWNQQQTTTQVLLHHHLDDEFCTNCGSCGAQDVAGGSLTL
jgi:hypothetical protein